MANGLLDLLGSALGTTPPSYMEGLLGSQAVEDLRKRSIGSGIVNALVGYAAMPKNQNLGLGRILAGAAQAGMQGAQGVYDQATKDYMMKQQIAELQRKAQQEREIQNMLANIQDPNLRTAARIAPQKYAENILTPQKRKTFVAPDGSIRFEDTGEVAQANVNVAERKALPTYEVQEGRTKYTIQVQPDGSEKIIGKGSLDAPKEPKALYSNAPVETPSGYVYMPTPEGIARGMMPIDAATRKPVQTLMTKEQLAEQDKQSKVTSQKEATLDQIGFINNAIGGARSILKSPLTFTAGAVGKTASLAGMPSRVELEGYIDTLKANLSFETLAEMRRNSPTGGALGSVSEGELRLLGSTVASLDPNLPKDVLLRNLEQVEKRYAKIKKALETDLGKQNIISPNAEMQSGKVVNFQSLPF